jgi:hypothetical protein
MSIVAYVLISLVAALAVGLLLLHVIRGVRYYLRFRGKRLITCPENQQPAAVEVNAVRAGYEAARHPPHLELSQCSRWPEKQGCGQECLRQIERAPEDCLVRTIVTKWYEGKNCALCGQPIREVEWLGHKPALLDPNRKTVYWDSIPAEKLPEVFTTHGPVCWDCHVAATLLREHPEVVTMRPWTRRPS